MKKRALVSVSDKQGIVEFCKKLESLGFEIISTGGTFDALIKQGVKAIAISEITGMEECLDGRVKTLHPNIHAGLLAKRSDKAHMEHLINNHINTIDIVAVNLYPFRATVTNPKSTHEEIIENIDIGGPSMLRSAAKNHEDVAVIVDPKDYDMVLEELATANSVSKQTKQLLAYKVFQHTAVYDSLIADYLRKKLGITFPQHLTLPLVKNNQLRYGENPHQEAALYKDEIINCVSIANAEQLNGKELSYNNINDTDGAVKLLREFSKPTVVAVKHSNACGVATADNITNAYIKTFNADPVSIFGGVIAANGIIDEHCATEMVKTFLEIVIAEDYTDEALKILQTKKNLRVLRLKDINKLDGNTSYEYKRIRGGMLVQTSDNTLYDKCECVTKVKPTKAQEEDMKFAYKVVKHINSNAIVLVKDQVTVGIGVGQVSRIWAAQQAIEHAGESANGSIMASDGLFPFDDCVSAAADANVACIIQPGGSIRDNESIAKCDEKGVAMCFCGVRHFKH